MLTPAQVRNHQFSASGRGTYRASEVDDFFASVCDSYEQMFRENSELIKKITLLADKVEEYKNDEDNIREALLTAQRMANKIISDSKDDAEKRLAEASEKAEQITSEAQKKADDTITSAQTTSEMLLSESKKNAEEILSEAQRKADERINAVKRSVTHETLVLEMTKREVSEFRASLATMYKQHIELINKIPHIVEEENKPEEAENTEAASAEDEQKTEPVQAEETAAPSQEETSQTDENESVYTPAAEITEEAEEFVTEDKSDDLYDIPAAQEETTESDSATESDFSINLNTVVDAEQASESREQESDDDDDDDDDGYETVEADSSDKDDYGEEPISFRNLFKRK